MNSLLYKLAILNAVNAAAGRRAPKTTTGVNEIDVVLNIVILTVVVVGLIWFVFIVYQCRK